MSDETAVRQALERVKDTCSVFNRTNLSIVDMGLVEAVRVDGSRVTVRLLLTDPMCSFFFEMGQRIREELFTLGGVDDVHVESSADELWTPERITPAGRERLEQFRADRLAASGLGPPRATGRNPGFAGHQAAGDSSVGRHRPA